MGAITAPAPLVLGALVVVELEDVVRVEEVTVVLLEVAVVEEDPVVLALEVADVELELVVFEADEELVELAEVVVLDEGVVEAAVPWRVNWGL